MMTRLVLLFLALALGAQSLAACGRVGPPSPPVGVPDTYPKAYPSADKN